MHAVTASGSTRGACAVGIVGFGTVGRAVARILAAGAHPGVRLTHVCNRNVARKRVDWAGPDVVWTDSFQTLLDSPVDVVVELVGGEEPARTWIERALAAGKSVVTANKQVMARGGPALLREAGRRGRHLLFEAAVAGGIPILRGLREGVAGDRLRRIRGVLNGTCNYILTRMEGSGLSFDEALAEARRLGYAEADPSADVDGHDARAKLAILVGVGLGRVVRVDDIPVEPITPVAAVDFAYARRLGCVIRQVAQAEIDPDAGGLRAAVRPALVSEASALGRVDGSRNIVVVDGEFGGETAFSGFGAGGAPTAVAVVSDLLAIASRRAAPADGWLPASDEPSPVVRTFEAPHYLRFLVKDRPGVIAGLGGVFSRHGVNLDAVLQEPGWPKTALPFVVTLEPCGSAAVAAALADAARFDFHVRPPLWLPMFVDRRGGTGGAPPDGAGAGSGRTGAAGEERP